MAGGIIQLVAVGSQDVYLTAQPQITFWKVVFKRHTNFAIEAIEQTSNGSPGDGNTIVTSISRNGDLIHKCYIVMNVPKTGKSKPILTSKDAHNLIESVELEIGGQQIDKQYGDWMTIWNQLSIPDDKRNGYERMVATDDGKIYIPLQFYFCQNPGLALPLIALQYHEVRIKIKFTNNLSDYLGTVPHVKLWVDYVYLDTDERRLMAQTSHEYLITQLQVDSSHIMEPNIPKTIRLNFNHPVKELIWIVDHDDNNSPSHLGHMGSLVKLSNDTDHKITLNGHERAVPREGRYYSHVQPYQHHTCIPSDLEFGGKINVYSFALKPEEQQPSGSCNFSKIDNAQLKTKAQLMTGQASLKVFATNWNILRIDNGVGGLAYCN